MGRAGRVSVLVLLSMLLLAALGATVAGAKDENTPDGATEATERFFEYVNDRRWGTYYRFLHPAQKALVSKKAFTTCFDEAVPDGLSVDNVDVTVVTRSTSTVPGTDTTAKVAELTVKYTLRQANAQRGVSDRLVLIWVENRWTWVMNASRLAECAGPPATG